MALRSPVLKDFLRGKAGNLCGKNPIDMWDVFVRKRNAGAWKMLFVARVIRILTCGKVFWNTEKFRQNPYRYARLCRFHMISWRKTHRSMKTFKKYYSSRRKALSKSFLFTGNFHAKKHRYLEFVVRFWHGLHRRHKTENSWFYRGPFLAALAVHAFRKNFGKFLKNYRATRC